MIIPIPVSYVLCIKKVSEDAEERPYIIQNILTLGFPPLLFNNHTSVRRAVRKSVT